MGEDIQESFPNNTGSWPLTSGFSVRIKYFVAKDKKLSVTFQAVVITHKSAHNY